MSVSKDIGSRHLLLCDPCSMLFNLISAPLLLWLYLVNSTTFISPVVMTIGTASIMVVAVIPATSTARPAIYPVIIGQWCRCIGVADGFEASWDVDRLIGVESKGGGNGSEGLSKGGAVI
jgi:hypothetical protein